MHNVAASGIDVDPIVAGLLRPLCAIHVFSDDVPDFRNRQLSRHVAVEIAELGDIHG